MQERWVDSIKKEKNLSGPEKTSHHSPLFLGGIAGTNLGSSQISNTTTRGLIRKVGQIGHGRSLACFDH